MVLPVLDPRPAAFLLVVVLAGCKSGPPLEQYPIRHIDRPYTLPQGVDAWRTFAGAGVEINEGSVDFRGVPIPIPLSWEASLADDWTLEVLVIPVGLRYQIHNDPVDTWGLRLGLEGFGFSSSESFIIGMSLGGYYRHLFTEDFGLETTLSVNPTFSNGSKQLGGGVSLGLAPVIQLSPLWWLRPKARVLLATTPSLAIVRTGDARIRTVRAPVGVDVAWLFHRQWEMSADYTFTTSADFQRQLHVLGLALTHFW